jgi:hypothetical protein
VIHRLALVVLTLASVLVLVTFLVPVPHGDGLFALATVVFPIALMTLGAARGGRLGPVAVPLLLLLLILLLATVGVLASRGEGVEGRWWGGLPAGAAFQLYGLFAVPLLVSVLGYALTFKSWGLRSDDLDDLRRRFPRPPEGEGEDRR